MRYGIRITGRLAVFITASALLFTTTAASARRFSQQAGGAPADSGKREERKTDVVDGGRVKITGPKISIPDLMVINQDGKRLRLYTDLIKDKTVVLSFFYTSCDGVCPSVSYSLSNAQAEMAERLGKDIFFVSISLDPETDRPKALKQWASKWQARQGWDFVAGKKGEMDQVVRQFTGGSVGRSAHGAVVFVGDDKRSPGIWLGMEPLIPPKVLVARIESIREHIAPEDR